MENDDRIMFAFVMLCMHALTFLFNANWLISSKCIHRYYHQRKEWTRQPDQIDCVIEQRLIERCSGRFRSDLFAIWTCVLQPHTNGLGHTKSAAKSRRLSLFFFFVAAFRSFAGTFTACLDLKLIPVSFNFLPKSKFRVTTNFLFSFNFVLFTVRTRPTLFLILKWLQFGWHPIETTVVYLHIITAVSVWRLVEIEFALYKTIRLIVKGEHKFKFHSNNRKNDLLSWSD